MPKLITDGRWSVVGSLKERRLIFDDFCKSTAADHMRQKSGKADGARAARDGFHALLDEASVQGVRMSGTERSVLPGHRSTFTSPLCLTGCERHALQYQSMYPWAVTGSQMCPGKTECCDESSSYLSGGSERHVMYCSLTVAAALMAALFF